MGINVLLSGKLKWGGYGQGKPENGDGTFHLDLGEGSTVQEVIQGMGIPFDKVVMTMINGSKCDMAVRVKPDDRVILIPQDVASLWRAFGRMNMGMESVFDF
jgi:hypothetical protein